MKGLHADMFNVPHTEKCTCEKCIAFRSSKYLSEKDRDSNLRYSLVSLISITPGITTNKLWQKVQRLRPGYTLKEYETVLKRILGDEANCTDSRWWLK